MLSLREWFGSESEVTTVVANPSTLLGYEQLGERITPAMWGEFSFGLSNSMSGIGLFEFDGYGVTHSSVNPGFDQVELWDLQIRITNYQGMDISTASGTADFVDGNFVGLTLGGGMFTMGSSNVFQYGVINWDTITLYDQSWNEVTGEINYDTGFTFYPPDWIDTPYPPNP